MGQRASQTTSGRHKDDCGRHDDHQLVQKGPKDLPQNDSECPTNKRRPKDAMGR